MDIVAAAECDLPAVERLYRTVADEMRGTSHDVWWEFGVHPTHETLLASVRAGNLFVATGEPGADAAGETASAPRDCGAGATGAVGAFVLDARQGADYGIAPWPVEAPDDCVSVLHLVAVAPHARGCGVARELLAAAVRVARSRGAWALRLDVFDNNAPAIAAYRRAGFADLGVFDIEVGGGLRHPSHLMELDLREGVDGR